MATTLQGNILLGSSPIDMQVGRAALDSPYPYVSWTTPSWFQQQRFSIRIANVESGGFAFTTSGPRESTEPGFFFPDGIALNHNFSGLCTVEVALSENLSGEFEYAMPVVTFVYDQGLERLFKSEGLAFSWTRAIDSDQQPLSGGTTYHLQVATDVNFNNLVYNNYTISDIAAAVLNHQPGFDPEDGQTFLFRARQSDGLDWGEWSVTNAFINYASLPPAITINSVSPLANEDGDVIITFTLADTDSDVITANFWFRAEGYDDIPVSLIESTVHVPTGSHTVTWKSRRQIGRTKLEGIVLFAQGWDGASYGNTDNHGPFTIDNSTIPPTGGLGGTETIFPVQLPRLVTLAPSANLPLQSFPTTGKTAITISETGETHQQLPVLVTGGPIGAGFVLGPVEKRTIIATNQSSKIEAGFGHDGGIDRYGDNVSELQMNALIRPSELGDLAIRSSFQNGWRKQPVAVINPHTIADRFYFTSPLDYANYSDAHPYPFNTREMTGRAFLHGWRDRHGVIQPYPDAYDWDNRPAWHADREVWGYQDAWIQVGYETKTGWEQCNTCDGYGWVASPTGPPYTREPCPNENCEDGFDKSEPFENNSIGVVIKPKWYRLSTFFNGKPHDLTTRTGLPITFPNTQVNYKLHIVGRHLTDKEAEYDGNDVTNYLIETLQGTRQLPPETRVEWLAGPFGNGGNPAPIGGNIPDQGAVTRQPRDAALVRGSQATFKDASVHHDVEVADLIAQGKVISDTTMEPDAGLPTAGNIGSGRSDFFIGSDPASHPGMSRRPVPNQIGVPTVHGRTGRVHEFKPLAFRFLQPWWDAYNTIHWQATGSATSKFHLQWSRYVNNVSQGWQDAIGDNATYDPDAGIHLVDPLVFHMFWNTANRQLFLAGDDYRLRVRMYDTISGAFTGWSTSAVFRIIANIPNPVSITRVVYEPWSKWTTLTIRIDDTEYDLYDLTGFEYSADDGFTWLPIQKNDIAGQMVGLTSNPADGQNIHTLIWQTDSYSLAAGNDYRVRITATPTDTDGNLSIPVFRWFSSPNPKGGPAESIMTTILGRTTNTLWDEDAGELVSIGETTQELGLLNSTQVALESVRRHETTSAPSGLYSFTDGDGAIVNPSGYGEWLNSKYDTTRTHGTALQQLELQQSTLLRELHTAQRDLQQSEIYCRKHLIDQGYYAEENFIKDGDIREIVHVRVLSQFTGDVDDLEDSNVYVDVPRHWRFRVVDRPSGEDGIYDDQGVYDPLDYTNYERVFYKFQLDSSSEFDSQSGKALRTVLYNHQGQRLRVPEYVSASGIISVSPEIDAARGQEGPWTTGSTSEDPDTQFGGAAAPTQSPNVAIGGVYKMPPNLLPGSLANDVLPDGAEDWAGVYQWRVAAYNAFQGQVNSRPRPKITSVTENTANSVLLVSYQAKAHTQIDTISMATVQQGDLLLVNGYEVSTSLRDEPIWTNEQAINYVSDRRAPRSGLTGGLNVIPWIPTGVNRPRPCVLFDEDQMCYLVYTAKRDYNNRWRPVLAKAVALPKACEYDYYFGGLAIEAIYSPWVIKHDGKFYMYLTVQATTGSLPQIYRSVSDDGDAWSNPVNVFGLGVAAYPSVVVRNGVWNLWFERYDAIDGKVKIHHASSNDGLTFTETDAAVITGSGDVGAPGVIWWSGVWVMYFNDGNTKIASMISNNGVTWTNKITEKATTVTDLGDGPVTTKPQHPCPFLDDYHGNEELFLAFNFVSPSGVYYPHTCRWEDRHWTPGVAGEIYGAAGNLVDVPTSPTGVVRGCSIDMHSNGIGVGSLTLPKVRFNFTEWSPTEIEYHRQSEWVTPEDEVTYGAALDPHAWTFSEGLRDFPYMALS